MYLSSSPSVPIPQYMCSFFSLVSCPISSTTSKELLAQPNNFNSWRALRLLNPLGNFTQAFTNRRTNWCSSTMDAGNSLISALVRSSVCSSCSFFISLGILPNQGPRLKYLN
ncbi:hypothetical protein ACQJBY_062767 [Aegilops geniculata]